MKIEMVNSDLITVFINNFYFKDIDIIKKMDLISTVKDMIVKIDSRYKLNLNGFYKIKVYPNKKIGVFLDIVRIDDNEFSSGADFRVVVYQNEKFFLETDTYDNLDYKVKKRYYNNKFYIDIEDIKDIYKALDMGEIIYGDASKEVIYYGKLIK